jgi:hypothetical protein
LTLKDLEMLEFWIHHLTGWMASKRKGNSISLFEYGFKRKIYVADQLKLYLSKNKLNWEFNLGKYLEYDGESIPHKALNNLRQYMDLCLPAVYSLIPIKNWALVNFEQNISIMTHLNEIPLITGLINRWLYDSI